MRANPAAYAVRLEERLPYYRGNILRIPNRRPLRTTEGAAAVRKAIEALRAAKPLPRLRELPGLTRAAEDHVREIGPRGLVSHESPDGARPVDRVRRYVRGSLAVGEVISFGPEDARNVVIDLLVDDAVPDRGHRKLLLDGRFRFGGAACGPHATYRQMCVIDMLVPAGNTAGNMATDDAPVAAQPFQP